METQRAGMSKGSRVTLRKGRQFRIRKLALVMAVAMASGRAYALGLGDIELHSALNEPLSAEVRLLAVQPGELKNAVVTLAPDEEFQRAGIERPSVLSDVNFDIVSDQSGASLVKITSTKPIREPFLDFVVQLSWQSGRLLREYTVLLDPPVFGEEKSAPVTAPQTEASAEASAPMPQPPAQAEPAMTAPAAEPMAEPAPSQPAPASQESQHSMAAPAPSSESTAAKMAGAHSYGPTQRNDTLWTIANSVRPDDSVSVYQTMVALLKENPRAFYQHNMNNLMAGFVLRVPDKSVIAAIDQKEAVRETARQYEQWQRAKRGEVVKQESEVPAASPQQGMDENSATAVPDQGQAKETARLRLVAPGDKSAGAAGGAQAELDKLRGELAIALESSDAAKQEGEDLRSRVKALEEQVNSQQHLLALKDQALSDMQKRSGLAVPPEAQAPVPPPSPEQAPPTEAKPVPAQPAPVAKPAPKPAPKVVKKPDESPDMFADPVMLGAMVGAALLLLTVAYLVIRRRRNAGDEGDGDQADATAEEMDAPAIDLQFAEEGRDDAQIMEEEAADPHINQVAEEVAQHAEEHIPEATSDLDVLHTDEGEIDPIVEADVYLAYRRYQQAEALVQGALDKQPDRQDLKLKLLEIYYAAKNGDAFQAMAQSLFENLGSNPDDPTWQRVLPMGQELCPEHELFGSSSESQQSGESAFAGDSELNKPVESEMTESSQVASGQAEEGALDLNLGSGESAPAQEENMDFDLNLGGGSAAPQQAEASTESLGSALDFEALESKGNGKDTSAEGEAMQNQDAATPWEADTAMSDFGNLDFGLEDTDLLAGTDVVGTKLDLARAYIDMGDNESAHDILKEVVAEGNEKQKQEATSLMEGTA